MRTSRDQLALEYGKDNTYGDVAGLFSWRGGEWEVPGAVLPGTKNGHPDLVVRKYATPKGPGYGVWDVKSAWSDGFLPYVNGQVRGYAAGISRQTGKPAVPGNTIAPQWRYWPQGPYS